MNGVVIQKLDIHSNNQGKVMHMMRCTDPLFTSFGEIYFSLAYPGVIKGWHKNNKSIKNYVVVQGNILLVLYDGKDIKEIRFGEDNYVLVQIPPGIWSSFKALGDKPAILVDLMDIPYTSSDSEKKDILLLNDYWRGKEE